MGASPGERKYLLKKEIVVEERLKQLNDLIQMSWDLEEALTKYAAEYEVMHPVPSEKYGCHPLEGDDVIWNAEQHLRDRILYFLPRHDFVKTRDLSKKGDSSERCDTDSPEQVCSQVVSDSDIGCPREQGL